MKEIDAKFFDFKTEVLPMLNETLRYVVSKRLIINTLETYCVIGNLGDFVEVSLDRSIWYKNNIDRQPDAIDLVKERITVITEFIKLLEPYCIDSTVYIKL